MGLADGAVLLTDGTTVEVQPDSGEILALLPPFACLDRFIAAGRAAGNPHRGPLTHKLVYRQARFTAVSHSTWPRTYWKRELLPLGRTLHGSAVRDQVNAVAKRLEGELGPEQYMFAERYPRDWDELPTCGSVSPG